MMNSSNQCQKNKATISKNIIFNHIKLRILLISLAILFVISIIFLSNGLYLYLKESILVGYSKEDITYLVILRTLKEFPLLISFAFIVSSLLAFKNMYKNSEALVLHNSGLNEIDFFKKTFFLFVTVVFLNAMFVNYFSPKIKGKIELIEEIAKNKPSYVNLNKKEFMKFNNSTTVFYADDVINKDNLQYLKDIKLFTNTSRGKTVTYAKEGLKTIDPISSDVYLELLDGASFVENNKKYNFLRFNKNKIKLFSSTNIKNNFEISNESLTTIDLLNIKDRKSVGEIIYRASVSLMIFPLYFLSISLAKTNPRTPRSTSFFTVIIAFLIYYNLLENFHYGSLNTDNHQLIGIISTHLIFIFISFFVYQYKKYIF